MKKVCTLGLFVMGAFFQQANAQIAKGEKMLGGSISFTSSKTDYTNSFNPGSKNNSFSVDPRLGFGLANNWIVGVGIGYSYSKSKTTGNGYNSESSTSQVSPALFVRKFHPFGDKFGIFGQAEAEYSIGTAKSRQGNIPEAKSDINGYSVAVRPGAYFKASRRFVIEASIGSVGYSSSTTKPDGSNIKVRNSQFNASFTNNLSLGFQVIL